MKRHLAADAYACVRIPGLLGEGAVQVLYSTDDYIVDPILAAVGQLQVRTWLDGCMRQRAWVFDALMGLQVISPFSVRTAEFSV